MANDVEQPLLEKKRLAYPNCRGCQSLYLQDADAKIPWKVFAVMAALTLVNALPISSLYPFLYFMVKDFKIAEDDKDIGFYAGYIGSAFMFGRFLTSVHWGMAADKYGRVPVMICGVISVLIFHTWFGASTTFWIALLSRFLLGSCNGMLGSVKAYASEVCSEKYQATSVSIVGTMWGLGLIIGPAMGGYFSQPAIKYPNVFPHGSLFDRYPYLLPSLLVTAVAFPTLFLTLTLPETLHTHDIAEVEKAEDTKEQQSLFLPIPETTSRSGSRKYSVCEGIGSPALISPFGSLPDSKFEDEHSDRRRSKFSSRSGSTRSQPDSNEEHMGATETYKDFSGANTINGVQGCQVGSSSDEEENKLTASSEEESDSNYTNKNKSLWTSRPLMGSITLYCVWSLHDMAYTEIFSLWCVSPTTDGGLDYTTTDVGQVLAISGFTMLLFQLFLFAPVVNFMGAVLLSRIASVVTVLLMVAYPGVTFLHGATLWWVINLLSILKNVFGTMVFTSSFLLVNNSVRTDQRGAANGIAMSLVSLFKAIGPAAGGSLYAWAQSRDSNILPGNQLVFFVLGVVVFLTVLCTFEPILPRSLDHKMVEDD
jgi:MFS family permease